jgi:hypothetical protein
MRTISIFKINKTLNKLINDKCLRKDNIKYFNFYHLHSRTSTKSSHPALKCLLSTLSGNRSYLSPNTRKTMLNNPKL